MTTSLLKKCAVIAAGACVIATTALLAGQAPAAPGAPAGQGGGRRGGGGGAGQAPAAPGTPGAPAGAQAGGRGGRGGGTPAPPQGGNGPVKVMLITKGHDFSPRERFFAMFDAMGSDITWTHTEHPASDVMMSPKYGSAYDAFVFYDLGGPGGNATTPDGKPVQGFLASNGRTYPNPSAQLKEDFKNLLKQGKGMVFLHHAAAAWAHTWPEYSEVVGGACDWYANTKIRGIDMPNHLFAGMTPQHITFVDKAHPIVKGLGDGFDVVDEAYACAWFDDSIHPIAKTDFRPADPARYLGNNWKYSDTTAWVKVSENSPVFYTQVGHGESAWTNPAYRAFVQNAIKWVASPEALAWAKANPTHIFK
jgi:type 1 glutamine amidotransferase